MKVTQINLSELDSYFELCKLEQTFRVKLHLYKELKEMELQKVKELKPLAEKLSNLKRTEAFREIVGKDLDRDIRNILNKHFEGGCYGK